MINKTLIAIDTRASSPETEQILDACRSLGSYLGEITAISVFKDTLNNYMTLDFTPLVEFSQIVNEGALTHLQQRLEQIITPCFPKAHCTVTIGSPAQKIVDTATNLNSDLIVMGTRGRHGIGRLVGSTCQSVFSRHSCDLLAARGSTNGQGYKNALIAVDYSAMTKRVLDKSVSLGLSPRQCSIVSIAPRLNAAAAVSPSRVSASFSPSHLQGQVEAHLRETMSKVLADHGMQSSELSIPTGDAAQHIVSKAKEIGADLILIGANNRSRLSQAFLGSTTASVLNNASCDVFVVANPTDNADLISQSGSENQDSKCLN